MSLNLKLGITNEHVTIVHIKKVFGPNCSSLKTTNSTLHLDTKTRKVLSNSIGGSMDQSRSQIMSSCSGLLEVTLCI